MELHITKVGTCERMTGNKQVKYYKKQKQEA